MKDVELVAVINSFNRISLLQAAVQSLTKVFKDCQFDSAIVVFDAGSEDGSRQWLEEYACCNQDILIDIIDSSYVYAEGSSFSAGVNAACLYAANKYKTLAWYLLFETDNYIASAQPLILAKELLEQNTDIAAMGFTVTKLSGQPAGYGMSFPNVWQFLLGQQLTHYFSLDRPKPQNTLLYQKNHSHYSWFVCDVVYTSPILVRRESFVESQGLDAKFFPFSDCDIDWAWRLAKLGWKLAVLSISGVVHDNRETLSAWSEKRAIHFHQARMRLLVRHVGPWVKLITPLLFLRHLLELCLLFCLALVYRQKTKSLKTRWILLTTVFQGYRLSA